MYTRTKCFFLFLSNNFRRLFVSSNKHTVVIIIALLSLVCLVIGANFYFMYYLNAEKVQMTGSLALKEFIKHNILHPKPIYLKRHPRFFRHRDKLLRSFQPAPYENASKLWEIANRWPRKNIIYPRYDRSMGKLLQTLRLEPITNVTNLAMGSQLKLLITLANQQKVVFKPQWYAREDIIDETTFNGKDRHTGEVYAFYLGAVLDLRSTPIAVGRLVHLKNEIYAMGDTELQNTMSIIEKGNGTEQYCLYGKCAFCFRSEAVCADEVGNIEGVLLSYIPGPLTSVSSPFYFAAYNRWQDDFNFCKKLIQLPISENLLYFVDVAIFDYLIQNVDRHHYEMRERRPVLLDNGKSFGNSYKDYFDILAPLYQCCILRKSTWYRLQIFSGGALTKIIDQLTKSDALYPLITEEHRRGVERRLIVVYAVVEYCKKQNGKKMFSN